MKGELTMKTNDLAKWCLEHPDVNVFMSNHVLDDDGELIDCKYYDLKFEVWDDTDPKSHFTIEPGELVSG